MIRIKAYRPQNLSSTICGLFLLYWHSCQNEHFLFAMLPIQPSVYDTVSVEKTAVRLFSFARLAQLRRRQSKGFACGVYAHQLVTVAIRCSKRFQFPVGQVSCPDVERRSKWRSFDDRHRIAWRLLSKPLLGATVDDLTVLLIRPSKVKSN